MGAQQSGCCGGRRQQAPAPTIRGGGNRPNPAYAVRQERQAGVLPFLLEFARRYKARSCAGAVLRAKYAGAEPPDLERAAESAEVTDELWTWLWVHCRERDLVFALYDREERPRAVQGEAARRQHGVVQEGYVIEWEDSCIRRHHLPLYAALGYAPRAAESLGTVDEGGGLATESIRVQWQPTFEVKQAVESWAESPALSARYERRKAEWAEPRPPRRPDDNLPELEQQGVLQQPRFSWAAERFDMYSLIEVGRHPVHPELDVVPPPGCTSPFIRAGEGQDAGTAFVHHPDGRWLGSLSCGRLANLRARFEHTLHHRPEVAASLGAGTFEQEVALLLERRRVRARSWQAKQAYENLCSAPAPLMEAIMASMGVDTELFASPLDVHAAMPAYASMDERDQLFGAGWDAYAWRWKGACFAHPPEHREEALKALRFAIAHAAACPAGEQALSCWCLTGGMHPTRRFWTSRIAWWSLASPAAPLPVRPTQRAAQWQGERADRCRAIPATCWWGWPIGWGQVHW